MDKLQALLPMDKLQAFLPSGEKGYLPYYLFVVSCSLPAALPQRQHLSSIGLN